MIVQWDTPYLQTVGVIVFASGVPLYLLAWPARLSRTTGITLLIATYSLVALLLTICTGASHDLTQIYLASVTANRSVANLDRDLMALDLALADLGFSESTLNVLSTDTRQLMNTVEPILQTAELLGPRQYFDDAVAALWVTGLCTVIVAYVLMWTVHRRALAWILCSGIWLLIGMAAYRVSSDVCSDFYGNLVSIIGIDPDEPIMHYYTNHPPGIPDPYAEERRIALVLVEQGPTLQDDMVKVARDIDAPQHIIDGLLALPIKNISLADIQGLDRNDLPDVYGDLESRICLLARAVALSLYVAPLILLILFSAGYYYYRSGKAL